MTTEDKNRMRAIKNGEIKVFEELFRILYPALCGYALKILKDPDQAEEIVQEVFYVYWKRREAVIINSSLKSYLYRAVHNKCLHYIEHQKVVNKYVKHYEHTEVGYYSPDDAIQTGELYTAYKRTLSELPERCRVIFQMSRNYGLKYQEIADKLSISIKTVEANMGKALKAFRHSLAEYQIQD
ncbi:MAG: RNA polymerase sigma-70 factor [Salinivirgaceae bacterium]|jgi:RNA polymerase sigma-70 factor (ECF subfamily)|nr:RNA polymerase sigma-70 factor [Salinivirgaceae bacterium]